MINLDYQATTPVDPAVLAAMLPYFTEQFGNAASRQHRLGWTANEAVEGARASVARLIGANAEAIRRGEDRQLFKEIMLDIGLDCARSDIAHTLEEARNVVETIGPFPLIIRPAFTLGGAGGGIAYNREELEEIVRRGLDLSPVCEVLI